MNRAVKAFKWAGSNKYLLLILLTAFLLRFLGTYPGYSQYHSDEPVVYGVAVNMIKNNSLDPGRYDYPAPVMMIQALFFKVIFIPLYLANYYFRNMGDFLDGLHEFPLGQMEYRRVLQEYVFGNREINALYWGRYVTALFGFGNVVLQYLFAKKLFNKKVAIISSLFLAFNFKHVVNSHLNLPDIYNSFFLLLSLYTTTVLWKNPTRKNYYIAGVACGISLAVKYQLYAALAFGVVHLYLSLSKNKNKIVTLFSSHVLIAVFSGVIAFLLLNPYLFINYEEAIRWSHIVFEKYGVGTNKINLFPISYIYHYDFGPLLFVGTITGMFLMVRNLKKLIFLLTPLLYFFYLFCFSSTGGFYIRNIISITPILLVIAAYGVYIITKFLIDRRSPFNKYIIIVLLISLLYVPARNSIINVVYNLHDWNFRTMAQWLSKNLPNGVLIAATPTDIPGGPTLNKSDFNLDGNFSINEHREAGAKWVLLNTDWASGNFYYWMNVGKESMDYWNKPWTDLRNTFHGLAAEEIIRYQTFNATKPWQAPDSNLVVAKIPDWPTVEMNEIAAFDFATDMDGWIQQGSDRETFSYDATNGNVNNGSITFNPSSGLGRTLRAISPVIKVKEGHLYEVSAFMKSTIKLDSRERQGFVRVDFFQGTERTKLGEISSVSSRVYGSDSWINKQVIERAPAGTDHMVVSFQISYNTPVKLWIDDVKIRESSLPVDNPANSEPYNFHEIDLNVLYPNSHGNL